MSEITVNDEELWREEPPLFGSPRYPILFPYIIFWVLVVEGFISWAAFIGDCRLRWQRALFGPEPKEVEHSQEEEEA